jgi:hypothetical protein
VYTKNRKIKKNQNNHEYISFSKLDAHNLESIVFSEVKYIGAGTTQVFIFCDNFLASSGVYFQVITAFQFKIGSFTFGAVSISHHTKIAICFQTNFFVNSQNILAHSSLNVSSTIG